MSGAATASTPGRGFGDGRVIRIPAEEGVRPPVDLVVERLGRMAYDTAFTRQRERHAAVLEDRLRHDGDPKAPRTMHLLFVEHDPPVITLSRRKGVEEHLVASPRELDAAGVVLAETDRGGDITYHGPGQLVAYPIVDLNAFALRLHPYMRRLEQAVIDVLVPLGIEGRRDETATGVWVDRAGVPGGAKICAMGVRVARWVTMHGLALNVTTNLAHFDLIVPCGLAGRPVTSIEVERRRFGNPCPAHREVEEALADALARVLAGQDPA